MVKMDRKRVLGVMIKDTKTFEKNRETSEMSSHIFTRSQGVCKLGH